MRWMLGLVLGGALAAPAAAQPCFAPVGWARPAGVSFTLVGRHFAFGGYWAPPPVWGIAPPVVVVQPVQFVELPPIARAPEPPLLPDPFAGARAEAAVARGEFVAIRPRKPDDVAPAPPKLRVVAPQGPPADPKQRAAFEITQAKEAFAAGQYGRATERLAEARKADPTDPRPHFWMAQSFVARGEYAEATAAIRDGLALAPDWPTKPFQLREIYGAAAATFDEHLGELKAAAKADPANATLAFLLGYHLWFLGEKAEAERLFRDAAKRLRDPTAIEAFLNKKP